MECKFLCGLAVLIGAVLFIYPMNMFGKVFRLTKKMPYRRSWLILIVMTVSFFGGYLFMVLHYLFEVESINDEVLIAAIMFFGSIFVLLSARLFYRIISSLDETVKKRTVALEKKHQEAMNKEKEVQHLKDQFLFIAAHELRTPVTAMKWNLDVLFDDDGKAVKKCGAEGAEMIADIRHSNDYLVQLVNDLLDASRMDYGTFDLKYEEVSPAEIANNALNMVQPLAKERGIKTSASFQDESCVIETDSRRLKEVLVNLLSNSIKYNVDGGKVNVNVHCDEKEIQFDVIDTGIGFSKEDGAKLFKKFSRLDSDAASEVRGTGLGLYIVKQIVEKMGGKIWAESEGLGKGSKFSFVVSKKHE